MENRIVGYDDNQYGKEEDVDLINNSFITNTETQERLTIAQIKEFQLLINPLDASVYSIKDGELHRDERFEYESY